MFGFVTANWKELTKAQQERYGAVYCGICRGIGRQSGETARLCLSYDIAFLSTLLMSLYEPEEQSGKGCCLPHPLVKRPWVDNEFVRYGADMNVALAYYNCLDDWQDDGKTSAKALAKLLEKRYPAIEERWSRQCHAIQSCIVRLSELEKQNCPNPDVPAGVFGELMAELFTYEEDLWAPTLRQMGEALGRFIYLMDAAVDYKKDLRKGKYNPYAAMGLGEDRQRWEEYLVLTMGRCAQAYERLPLVQDKPLLDNILYSGVWVNYRRKRKEEDRDDRGSV